MNYRYEISGHLTTDKPINSELKDFINTFSKTRHCQRHLSALNKAIAQTPNAEKYAVQAQASIYQRCCRAARSVRQGQFHCRQDFP